MKKAGERLAEARMEKGLSLEDVSKSTKIKVSFLEYIEKSQYQELPSVSYAQGFVKNYAKYLGLNEKEIMALFRREFDEDKAYNVLPKGLSSTNEFSTSGFKVGQTFIFILLIFAVFLFYILYQYRGAFLNPPLSIDYPKNMSTVNSSEVKVTGKTDPNATLYVDDNAVALDQNGNFSEILKVFPGKETITLKVINKFQRVTVKSVIIYVKGGGS